VRSLTSLRSSASKSRTGSAGVRRTGSPNRRIGLTLNRLPFPEKRRARIAGRRAYHGRPFYDDRPPAPADGDPPADGDLALNAALRAALATDGSGW